MVQLLLLVLVLVLLEARVSVLGVGLSRLDLDDDDDDVDVVIVIVMGYVALLVVDTLSMLQEAAAFSPCILTGGMVKGVGVIVSVGVAKSKTVKDGKKQTQKQAEGGEKKKKQKEEIICR